MIITFEQVKHSGKSGLDGAFLCAFPGALGCLPAGLETRTGMREARYGSSGHL